MDTMSIITASTPADPTTGGTHPAVADPQGSDPRPLGEFPALTAVTVHERPTLILGRAEDEHAVEVYRDDSVRVLDASVTATIMDDRQARADLLEAALIELRHMQHVTADDLRGEQARHAADRCDWDEQRQQIREYAVRQYRDGYPICTDGLVEFLQRFDMTPLRVRVTYTLSGSYEVDGDADAAESDASSYLKPDLSDLDNVVEGSDIHEVHIEGTEPVDD